MATVYKAYQPPMDRHVAVKVLPSQLAESTDLFLTNNDDWGTSTSITKNASSYRLGADCGNGKLTLYVDEQQIVSVSDSSYTTGGVGLLTWSAEEATTTDVSFDDFVMTELP